MQAPQNPTVVSSNPVADEYVILFAPELSEFIRKDGKVKTYRYGDKYDYLKIGDSVELREYGTNDLISNAVINNKENTTFGELPLDLNGHEVYESKDHQRKVFSSYYKYLDRDLLDEDPFLVFSFDLVE